MAATAGFSQGAKDERCWCDFTRGARRDTVDVRDFITRNVAPYETNRSWRHLETYEVPRCDRAGGW